MMRRSVNLLGASIAHWHVEARKIRVNQGKLLRSRAHMATLFVLLMPVMWTIAAVSPAGAQEVPELKINSKYYIVIDAETGEVFAQRGATERVAIASLTKVFTAIEAIESAPLDTVLVTSDADLLGENNSLMGFDPGEELPLEELLYGLMLPSGNDAALAIARNLGSEPGDTPEQAVQRFVDRTNLRIQDMGLSDTHLMNPHGWGVPNHYSTARDLATFTMYALQYPDFVKLISTPTYTTGEGFKIRNNNRLLTELDFPGLIGGKTGYDWDSGWCLIEVAERNGNTMISVTLDGYHENNDWYDDNRVLLNYAFEQKEQREASGQAPMGDKVSFLDPDAAVISRTASAGVAIGSQVDPSLVALNGQDIGTNPRPSHTVGGGTANVPGSSPIGLDQGMLSALSVALAIIGAQAGKTALSGRERRMRQAR
jgi:D-alanyl-D-alanine carboxypeptidase (penicillin-binding protein 5/6)